jgi:hypothetical protein
LRGIFERASATVEMGNLRSLATVDRLVFSDLSGCNRSNAPAEDLFHDAEASTGFMIGLNGRPPGLDYNDAAVTFIKLKNRKLRNPWPSPEDR